MGELEVSGLVDGAGYVVQDQDQMTTVPDGSLYAQTGLSLTTGNDAANFNLRIDGACYMAPPNGPTAPLSGEYDRWAVYIGRTPEMAGVENTPIRCGLIDTYATVSLEGPDLGLALGRIPTENWVYPYDFNWQDFSAQGQDFSAPTARFNLVDNGQGGQLYPALISWAGAVEWTPDFAPWVEGFRVAYIGSLDGGYTGSVLDEEGERTVPFHQTIQLELEKEYGTQLPGNSHAAVYVTDNDPDLSTAGDAHKIGPGFYYAQGIGPWWGAVGLGGHRLREEGPFGPEGTEAVAFNLGTGATILGQFAPSFTWAHLQTDVDYIAPTEYGSRLAKATTFEDTFEWALWGAPVPNMVVGGGIIYRKTDGSNEATGLGSDVAFYAGINYNKSGVVTEW